MSFSAHHASCRDACGRPNGVRCAQALGLGILLAAQPGFGERILASKHNLSVSSPGTVKSVMETEVCSFCHTPHRGAAAVPRWDSGSSGKIYVPYRSSTTKAVIGQPTGTSKMCLSCHDGTVAASTMRGRTARGAARAGWTALPPGPARLGTDLSDDHPISFKYDSALTLANGQLRHPSTLTGTVRLDNNGELQCTTCHDPHDNRFGKFLVRNNTGSALCTTCHDQRSWTATAHSTSSAQWNGLPPNPWPRTGQMGVSANGCENCHRPHSAGTKERLLIFPGEEANCYSCHNGNVATKNVQREFNKASVHPVANTIGIHDPTEDPLNPARHVECVDCHNPHAAQAQNALAPRAPGSLAGVKGVSSNGGVVNPLVNEYELCYRCHADSVARGPARVTRQFLQTNTRLDFQGSNLSFHPVETTGKNADCPSLIAPWTTSSMMYCTDCHNNNQGTRTGGNGPNGPHGSSHIPLLERRQDLVDFQPESSALYALCYKCHSRSSILSDASFKGHQKHVVGAQTACTTCHDSHGVATVPHLINFNTTYVTPSSKGILKYQPLGPRRGQCYLSCHGKDHNPLSY